MALRNAHSLLFLSLGRRLTIGAVALVVFLGAALQAADVFHGLPFLRIYPYDEIGYASRSAHIAFDTLGRVAMAREGAFVVLNDDIWINLTEEGQDGMAKVFQGSDGQLYFGSRSNWGLATTTKDGHLVPQSLTPPDAPDWTHPSYFDEFATTNEGVFLGSWNGSVFIDYKERRPHYLPNTGQNCLFTVGNRVFAANFLGNIIAISFDGEKLASELIVANGPSFQLAATFGKSAALLCDARNEFYIFNGNSLARWSGASSVLSGGRISCLRRLVDGNMAVAELGNGLFIFSQDGQLLHSFTAPRFKQISDIGNNEAGVLWLTTDDSLVKILYDCPIENFSHDLGILPLWPVLAELNGTTFAISDGVLYYIEGSHFGKTATFKACANQPPEGAWNIASNGQDMLVASHTALFTYQNGQYTMLAKFSGLANLVMVAPDLCIATSQDEIGAFKYEAGRWAEAAPRIPGVGYSPIAQAADEAVWLEMAREGAALVKYDRKTATLSLRHFRPWPDAGWSSVSVLKDFVMLTGGNGQRLYYKPSADLWLSTGAIADACNSVNQSVIRLGEGHDGTLWGMTNKGVVAFYKNGDAYLPDTASFDFINDLYPSVQVLPSGAVWITANQSIYRASTDFRPKPGRAPKATVVSVFDGYSNVELPESKSGERSMIRLASNRNSISIRLFSGTYNNRRPSGYVYRIGSDPWAPIDTGSLLSLRELKEGSYQVEIKPVGDNNVETVSALLDLSVDPPWFRSGPAMFVYVALALAAVYAAMRISNRVARLRSESLELLVSERTGQLETAMQRLNEETRVAATLAERNRLAGEIHDSLQQGLSGAILQIDSTIHLPNLDQRVKARLGIVRNMISFTRHEVQNAVWDKESPLLGDSELGEALHKLTSFINTDASHIKVCVQGTPRALPAETKHHLMRIAQEATTNAVRHAQAQNITISLTYEADTIQMTVEDDGVGFEPAKALNIDHGHFGLRGLRSRAKRLNAAIEIVSAPGAGARIDVRVSG